MEIVPEEGWRKLAQEIAGRTVLLVGATDAGKTTLARYLLAEMPADSYPVALVDADIGQSSLGLPGTVALGVFRDRADARHFNFGHLAYVGTTNAAKAVNFLADRTAAMALLAQEEGARSVLVDTTGLVQGRAGRALKTRKIELVRPDVVVGLERERELKPVFELTDDPRVILLPASTRATTRTPAARARHRREQLRHYFQGAGSARLDMATLSFTIFGSAVTHPEAGLRPGSVVGLGHAEETLALGLVEGTLADTLIVRTPLERTKDIRRVATGEFLLERRSGRPVI